MNSFGKRRRLAHASDSISMMVREEHSVARPDGAPLSGTLTMPAMEAPLPAIVGVHGAGHGTRENDLYRHMQRLLAQHGIATLFFDRRGEGASTGDTQDAGFEVLAEDVSAWVRELRADSRLLADRIGLWCISQGGWIAALAAARDPAIACVVAVSPSGVTAAEQMNYATACLLREAAYPEAVVARALAIRAEIDAYFRGHTSLEAARAAFEAARHEPWFELAWLPEPTDPPHRWRLQMDFDIRPVLAQVRCPLLLIYGEWDRWVPIEASLDSWRSALHHGDDLAVVRIDGAGHQPTLAADRRDWNELGPIAPQYDHAVTTWLSSSLARVP